MALKIIFNHRCSLCWRTRWRCLLNWRKPAYNESHEFHEEVDRWLAGIDRANDKLRRARGAR